MSTVSKKNNNTLIGILCFCVCRMSDESMEERSVEVLELPDGVDEELLYLYFENKRRSGGGPLESVEKKENHAILVFEEAEGKSQSISANPKKTQALGNL